jgi:hypothetical protein
LQDVVTSQNTAVAETSIVTMSAADAPRWFGQYMMNLTANKCNITEIRITA